ncbi:MAG: DUF4293 domain-containing protein [Vicingaceae bacterium]
MLQRIQTVYLGLVVILGFVFSFIPVLGFSYEGNQYFMNAYHTVLVEENGVKDIFRNMGVGTLSGLVVLNSLIVIFLYKKRQLQIKLCKLNILLLALEVAGIALYADAAKELIAIEGEVETKMTFGIFIPVISLILTYLATRAIRKDEELVRAADRLR